MNVNSINNYKINKYPNLSFKSNNQYDIFFNSNQNDYFDKSYDNNLLTRVKGSSSIECTFKQHVNPSIAILSLVKSSDINIKKTLLYHRRMIEDLEKMALDVSSNDFLKNIKIKKLLDLGAFALVFETDNGQILKLTKGTHYPNNRKSDFFDLPVKKQGKVSNTYYYLEEKISQENITQNELEEFVKKIKEKGYFLVDYMYFDYKNDKLKIKTQQFGKTKDGTLYLIDPGCVMAPVEKFSISKFLSKLFSKIKK